MWKMFTNRVTKSSFAKISYIIWSWKTISGEWCSETLWYDICELILQYWYIHTCTRFQLLIYSFSIPLWCLMFLVSALFGATSPKKHQKIRLNTRKDLPTKRDYIYIEILCTLNKYIYICNLLIQSFSPKKIKPHWISKKKVLTCGHLEWSSMCF